MTKNDFRGKPIGENATWAYGGFAMHEGRTFIVRFKRVDNFDEPWQPYLIEVQPNTVGKFSGMKDKDGEDIYSGDTVKCHYIEVDKSYKDEIVYGVVKVNDGCFDVELENADGKWRDYLKVFVVNHAVKITGTIYD